VSGALRRALLFQVEAELQVSEIILGFKAFDVHELLLHFVASRLGFYLERGLKVELKDLSFVPDEQLDASIYTVACGSVLLAKPKTARRKVVLVAAEHPMFWMYAQKDIARVSDLRGHRVATYPEKSPPWFLHLTILQKYGLDPNRDVRLEAARDNEARLGLLASGNVRSTVVSSAVPRTRVQSAEFRELLFFGDEVRIPTTGLTASEDLIERDPEQVRKVVSAFEDSLVAVHESPSTVLSVIMEFLGDSSASAWMYECVKRCFTSRGRPSPEAVRSALALVNQWNAVPHPLKEKDVYDYSLLGS
jgi:ABC-type nitrate/sulfonate/bicarbonate transport system substrate-binding protein